MTWCRRTFHARVVLLCAVTCGADIRCRPFACLLLSFLLCISASDEAAHSRRASAFLERSCSRGLCSDEQILDAFAPVQHDNTHALCVLNDLLHHESSDAQLALVIPSTPRGQSARSLLNFAHDPFTHTLLSHVCQWWGARNAFLCSLYPSAVAQFRRRNAVRPVVGGVYALGPFCKLSSRVVQIVSTLVAKQPAVVEPSSPVATQRIALAFRRFSKATAVWTPRILETMLRSSVGVFFDDVALQLLDDTLYAETSVRSLLGVLIAFAKPHFIGSVDIVQSTARLHTRYAAPTVLHGDQLRIGQLVYDRTIDGLHLTGEGEIVGVADEAFDPDHCFFADNPNDTLPALTLNGPVSLDRRKVVHFAAVGGTEREFRYQGHGTLTAGMVAGEPLPSVATAGMEQWSGVAVAAQLALFQISDAFGVIQNVVELGTDSYYRQLYHLSNKARVMSESWGGGSTYSVRSALMDEFVYEHRDFVIIRSAGNDGPALSTITGDAQAKNVVSVGATLNARAAFVQNIAEGRFPPSADYACEKYDVCTRGFYSPADCCNSSVIQVVQWCCGVSWTAPPDRFSVDVLADFSSRGPAADGRIKPDVLAPGEYLYGARGEPVVMRVDARPCNESALGYSQGTSFSAPLVAGAVALLRQFLRGLSVTDSGSSDGTSSSPRMVFEDSVTPSAALLRALLLSSGEALASLSLNGSPSPLPGPTSNLQGFGRINLANVVVPLRANASQRRELFMLSDEHHALRQGQQRAFCFRGMALLNASDTFANNSSTASTASTSRVTLTWTDPPALSSDSLVLVNDLDLTVFVYDPFNSSTFIVNKNDTDASASLPQASQQLSGAAWNPNNNNEQVEFALPALTSTFANYTVVVVVQARRVVTPSQDFALVYRQLNGGDALQWSVAEECPEAFLPQCVDTTTAFSCSLEHGVGEYRCKNGALTKCLVVRCDVGYTPTVDGRSCRSPLTLWQLVILMQGIIAVSVLTLYVPVVIQQLTRHKSLYCRIVPNAQQVSLRQWSDLFGGWPTTLACVAALLSVVATAAELLQPVWVAELFTKMTQRRPISDATNAFALIASLAFVNVMCSSTSLLFVRCAAVFVRSRLRSLLYRRVWAREPLWFRSVDLVGQVAHRFSMEVRALCALPSEFGSTLAANASRLFTGFALCVFISWRLSLVAVGIAFVLAVTSRLVGSHVKRRSQVTYDRSSQLAGQIADTLESFDVVVSNNTTDTEMRLLRVTMRRLKRAQIELAAVASVNSVVQAASSRLVVVATLWLAAYFIENGLLTVGLLVAYLVTLAMAAQGAVGIAALSEQVYRWRGTGAGVGTLLNPPHPYQYGSVPIKRFDEIKLSSVSFRYPQARQDVLRNVTMALSCPQVTWVVGPSGQGKSTLILLLVRSIRASAGAITVDGRLDLLEIAHSSLTRLFALIPQQIVLPPLTVRELLCFSAVTEPVADDELWSALSQADALEWVRALPDRVDTVAAARMFSGGQKKSLIIARTILGDAQLLCCDELHADLDPALCTRISALFEKLAASKCVVHITHSLDVLRPHHRVFMLKDGQLREHALQRDTT